MGLTKIIAKFAYIASWMLCILPNSPSVQGHSYDEPTISEQVMQIIQNDEVVEDDDVCYFPKQDSETISNWDLDVNQLKKHQDLKNEEYPENYDSGDYGDY